MMGLFLRYDFYNDKLCMYNDCYYFIDCKRIDILIFYECMNLGILYFRFGIVIFWKIVDEKVSEEKFGNG